MRLKCFGVRSWEFGVYGVGLGWKTGIWGFGVRGLGLGFGVWSLGFEV